MSKTNDKEITILPVELSVNTNALTAVERYLNNQISTLEERIDRVQSPVTGYTAEDKARLSTELEVRIQDFKSTKNFVEQLRYLNA